MGPCTRAVLLSFMLAMLAMLAACGSTDDPVDAEGCSPACGAGTVCTDGRCVAESPTCDPACEEGSTCEAGVCVPDAPLDADGDGVADAEDACPDTEEGARVDLRGCSLAQFVAPLPTDGFGVGVRDFAADFTLTTLDGGVSFHELRDGRSEHVFFLHQATSSYSHAIWESDPAALLAASAPTTHYWFFDLAGEEAERRTNHEALRARFEAALARRRDAADWEGRLHFVLDDPRTDEQAPGQVLEARPEFAFAIDGFGRWRQVGLLAHPGTSVPELRFLALEALSFVYERELAWELGARDATEVVVFDGDRHVGGWESGYSTAVEVEFPPADEMARFDSMAVWIYTACPDHLQGLDAGCNEWDYAHHLFVCDEGSSERCETELVRYVTPYGREGEWLTDVSELLPLFAGGGKRTLRYEGANGYDMHLRILLWDAGKPWRPAEARFLWGASGPITWDLEYNGLFEPVRFTVDDPETVRAAIYNVVTGHGFGSTFENCAEFCNSTHEFSVNGTLFQEAHPEAGSPEGCLEAIDRGVVPNQFGTWPFGRAGWCPGQDVEPWVQDVSEALVSGENEIDYRALFLGNEYRPILRGDGTAPELRLQSWLIRYEAR